MHTFACVQLVYYTTYTLTMSYPQLSLPSTHYVSIDQTHIVQEIQRQSPPELHVL